MALQTFRTDDITGEPDAQTVLLVVNGKGVEVDLSDKSMTRLVKALEPFWKVGSEGDYLVTRREPGKRKSAPVERAYDLGELRAWAKANGIAVPSRGRIPGEVVDQYLQR